MFGRRAPASGTVARPEAELYDAETGLPGRALTTDRLLMALRGAERTGHEVAVVLVEVTSIESHEGPASADDTRAVLFGVGDRLSAVVRGFDSVGRIGPTTFAVVLQGEVGEEGLRTLARRVIFELSPPVVVDLRQHFALVRLGGTTARPGQDDPTAMLVRAEAALFGAQQPGAELFVLEPAGR